MQVTQLISSEFAFAIAIHQMRTTYSDIRIFLYFFNAFYALFVSSQLRNLQCYRVKPHWVKLNVCYLLIVTLCLLMSKTPIKYDEVGK